MKNYIYQNDLIGKKQLRQLLAWSFTNYDSMQACSLADELKYLGFKYASQAGISISIEDLKVPFVKNLMLEKANQEILNAEKIYQKGKMTDVERFQKIIDTWSLTSESLKDQIIYYFKNYDPLNSVYIMAFSGARGNLSQVRQLVGMRGLMSDPSGQIMNLPIKKNFREGLTITDYLMSGYGARKGIVDTALKTANSGYLTRRLIDVAQDILIREKDCLTNHSFLFSLSDDNSNLIYDKLIGQVLNKPIFDLKTNKIIAHQNTQITPNLVKKFKEKNVTKFYTRSPLTCNLYRAICQKCYGWDLANENLVDIGEAIGILAGQSIGEPGTQLTMRTFHTGGIFTSEARQQIKSPFNGIIQFYKILKTVVLRTNRGEDVLVTKNSGSLILIPENKNQELIQIEVLRNTILFPKNNQYVLKDTVIGELINTNKQVKTEVKPILSDKSGEIFIPQLKKRINLLNNNKLIWILSGELYNSPSSSFINFYSDYKLNRYSYIFRTKLINHYSGFVQFLNNSSDEKSLYQSSIRINNIKYSLLKSKLEKLELPIENKNYLLTLNNSKYLVKVQKKINKTYLQVTRNGKFGTLLTNSFRTLTGGTLYYNHRNLIQTNTKNEIIRYRPGNIYDNDISEFYDTYLHGICYVYQNDVYFANPTNYLEANKDYIKQYYPLISHRTILWLGHEIHRVKCDPNILLVEEGDFISEGFELIPGLLSKTSGLVNIQQKSNFVKAILIKSGLVYEGNNFKKLARKVYYPGEIIFSNITIKTLSFCEHIVGKNLDQLLVRPIEIYEFPYLNNHRRISQNILSNNSIFQLESKAIYLYKSSQIIHGVKSLNLVSNLLTFNGNKSFNNNINIELSNNFKINCLNFKLIEKLCLKNYISPYLRYKDIQSCFLVQENQYISSYTTLGYLEAVTKNSLEIVKFKIKQQYDKQILLISNKDCLTIKKENLPNNKLNDFITNGKDVNKTGKIIIENDRVFTIQKGRSYFFPNCKTENFISKTKLQYKLLSQNRVNSNFITKRDVQLNYYNIDKILTRNFDKFSKSKVSIKLELPKLFLKSKGKFYRCLRPLFFKKFSIHNNKSELKVNKLIQSDKLLTELDQLSLSLPGPKPISRTLLMQSSEIIYNKFKNSNELDYQLTMVKFMEHPFTNSKKAIGLYSITEDYFEQEMNSVFCKNTEFIDAGKTIGLLNLEKEITGDIVQGLPRIEEILEARKKNILIKNIPTSQKKGLLVQKTSLDPNFEFKKLGSSIKENDKINPHKLLKVYFNYYGLIKSFTCDRLEILKLNRLLDNYESSYKSFKKVQSFILNSVQSIYQSQGVTINDKHLEVIVKQMTTKVIITSEGDTPLLRREVIDLYHIQYINEILSKQMKSVACYVPLLLGITKAALNNPSFISAASFQETTRVLTKAAIEGRIDWLRGLKENIIIGNLIPAGTGSQNYQNCFKTSAFKTKMSLIDFDNGNDNQQKSRQAL